MALAVLTSFHRINIAAILGISLLTGIAMALNYPAYQALIPDLVPREDLLALVRITERLAAAATETPGSGR